MDYITDKMEILNLLNNCFDMSEDKNINILSIIIKYPNLKLFIEKYNNNNHNHNIDSDDSGININYNINNEIVSDNDDNSDNNSENSDNNNNNDNNSDNNSDMELDGYMNTSCDDFEINGISKEVNSLNLDNFMCGNSDELEKKYVYSNKRKVIFRYNISI